MNDAHHRQFHKTFFSQFQFNIYDLGKFIKSDTFTAKEPFASRTFPSKVFLFERCLLYTKFSGCGSLRYRDHFAFKTAFITQESHVSIRVSGPNKKQDVVFSSDNIDRIANMKKHINQFYDPRQSGDSAFVDGNELMICEDQDVMTDDDEDWTVTECQSRDEQGGKWKIDLNICSNSSHSINLPEETVHVANSRFYIKSPEPDCN